MADENRIRCFKNKGKDTDVSFGMAGYRGNEINASCLGDAEEADWSDGGAAEGPQG